MSASAAASADDQNTILLWPHGAPGAKGDADKDIPKLFVHCAPAEKSVGTAVIICPGGGYGHLSLENEGSKVAEWLNSLGVTAFVLDYRHAGKGYHHPAPMDDAQRPFAMCEPIRPSGKSIRPELASWASRPVAIWLRPSVRISTMANKTQKTKLIAPVRAPIF